VKLVIGWSDDFYQGGFTVQTDEFGLNAVNRGSVEGLLRVIPGAELVFENAEARRAWEQD
jgi:hypothetical protein